MFFVLVFTLTSPFWLLSKFLKVKGLPDNLPVTDIGATFVPLISAVILVYRADGVLGVRQLLARAFDYDKMAQKRWLLPVVLLMPCIYLLTYYLMRAIGVPVPTEWRVSPQAPLIFFGFLVAAAGEELGYMGYAINLLLRRWRPLQAALFMGTIHAVWHYPSMIELGQSPALMFWGTLFTIAVRVLIVWIYINTRSVFAIILFHAIGNTGRTLFPGGRAAFELGDAAVGYSIVVITAVVVAAVGRLAAAQMKIEY